MAMSFRIYGKVVEEESRKPLPNLIVRAYDKDFLFDDFLGNTKTNVEGQFDIRYSESDFQELFSKCPDLYIKVYDSPGEHVIHLTTDSIRWNSGYEEYFEIAIPKEKVPRISSEETLLLDSQGCTRNEFEVGDTLLTHLYALSPDQNYTLRLLDSQEEEVYHISVLANRYGEIEPTVLWPDIGLGFPDDGNPHEYYSVEEALATLSEKTFAIEVLDGEEVIRKKHFTICNQRKNIRLTPVSESGVLQRGLLHTEEELFVQGDNFPPESIVDIYLVKRQYDWRVGDTFEPIRNEDGTVVKEKVRLNGGETSFTTLLWARDKMLPGSYDIIARIVLDHEFRAEEQIFRSSDLASERLVTTVVIRSPLEYITPFRGSPIPPTGTPIHSHHHKIVPIQIAGEKLKGAPHFTFTNIFPVGADIWAAMDPTAIISTTGKRKIRYYVVKHRDNWKGGEKLKEVRTVNKKNIVTTSVTTAGCINGNIQLIWSNAKKKGDYDLIVDLGTPPVPVKFKGDGLFNPDKGDLIDKLPNVGFKIVDDPSVKPTRPSKVTDYQYNNSSVDIKASGVQTPGGVYGAAPHGVVKFEPMADVYYPHTTAKHRLPIFLIIPGFSKTTSQHTLYAYEDGFDYLLKHVAEFDFAAICMRTEKQLDSYLPKGAGADSRVNAIFEHLFDLESQNVKKGHILQGRLDFQNIYLMGFGEGADAALEAVQVNQKGYVGNKHRTGPGYYNIKGVIAVSPQDQRGGTGAAIDLSSSKLLTIYGSNDGVNTGSNPKFKWSGSGFSLYDRAKVEKSMVFIEGGTYGLFNQQDNLAIGKMHPGNMEGFVDPKAKGIASAKQHEDLLKGYVTAFLEYQRGQLDDFKGYLTGSMRIPQAKDVNVYVQYQNPGKRLVVENYESSRKGSTAPSKKNRLGGTISYMNLSTTPQENMLSKLDSHCIHEAPGIKIKWDNTSGQRYFLDIPSNHTDISSYGYLSFRVAQVVGSASNPKGKPQNFWISLKDKSGNERYVQAAHFGEIPYPYRPQYAGLLSQNMEKLRTKSALTSIRIPLHAFTLPCVPEPRVDLKNIVSVVFDFDHTKKGEILLTDIEFTH